MVRTEGDKKKVAPISHEAVAAICILSLLYTNEALTTISVMTLLSGEGEDTWDPLLEAVRADTRVFPARNELVAEHLKAARLSVRSVARGLLVAVITGLMGHVIK